MNGTQLIEAIDDAEGFLSRPGRYYTTTAHPAYAVLQTLGWHPWVKLGQELYFPEGSVLFAEVNPIKAERLQPNVQKMGWGTTEDYYERRLRDYDNWEVAFWREIIQNSRDAGATRVDMECVPDTYTDPETGDAISCVRCTATDDGRGMSYETMMSAFFRRGGSLKDAGSVGGFGDAKNLILTPWLGYEVRSQSAVVRGRHEDIFADLSRDGEPYLSGTRLTVWMPDSKTTTPEHAQFIVEQSSLSQIRFTVNGKLVKESLPRGKLIDEKPIVSRGATVGTLQVYHSPRASRFGIYVRSHGIYMYEMHGFQGDFKGVVTIEVNAPPINVFTTKRDSLSYESSARADVQDVLQRLTSDPRVALKAKRDKKMQVFLGSGSIALDEGRVAELAADVASRAEIKRQPSKRRTSRGAKLNSTVTLDKGALSDLLRAFTEAADQLDQDLGEPEDNVSLRPLPATFGALMSQGEFMSVEQVAGAIKVSMWQPDFFLYQNISPWTMPKALHPETMSAKYHTLLRLWTEVCKFVLVQVGLFKPFGVGWAFDTDYDPRDGGESVVGAMWVRHEGRDWLLVNPVNIERSGYDDNMKFELVGDRFDLSNPRDIEELVVLAIHEVTHMQGYAGHGDAYASALTENAKAVFRIQPVLKQIVKEARAAVRERRREVPSAVRERNRRPPRPAKRSIEVGWDYPGEWTEDDSSFNYGMVDGTTSVSIRRGAPWEDAAEGGRYIVRVRENGEWVEVGRSLTPSGARAAAVDAFLARSKR
jgi:hypothetical protein